MHPRTASPRLSLASLGVALTVAGAACGGGAGTPDTARVAVGDSVSTRLQPRLPTGVMLDPAAAPVDLGSMPLAAVLSPDGRTIAVVLSGYREQGVQLVDRATMRVTQTLVQPAAFIGAAWSPDGRSLYVSGGDQDCVYRYDRAASGAFARADSLVLAVKQPKKSGTRYPAGIALSPSGATLYVAENLADSLAVVDVASKRVTARFATGRYPYGVAVSTDGTVYVSAWGANTVAEFAASGAGALLTARGRLEVARHPSALLVNREGSRLFVASGSTDHVAVVDTRARRVVARLADAPPTVAEGSTPNALALSPDGLRLYVAEADANAAAIFDLSAATAGITSPVASAAAPRDTLAGRVPAGWYPTAVVSLGDTLVVVNGKGRGTAANPTGPTPATGREDPRTYTLGQTSGTLIAAPVARARGEELDALSRRVAHANGWDRAAPARASYPPFTHVVYVVKENRTYDQILGDLPQADGDPSLVFFPRPVSPNHHALAERFGIHDRFFVNAEVSPDGHNWSMAAYATDYLEKTVPSNYSNRGRTYDYEGTNRGFAAANIPDDDVAEPSAGYLWDLARRKGITFRNYGEFVVANDQAPTGERPSGYRGDKPALRETTNPDFPGFTLSVPDQTRADIWIAELGEFAKRGEMPQLEVVRLPNDHTAGARAGSRTPAAFMADNDLALGRMIEALSKSPFWASTVVFVVEDDAQNGPDHVDSHRSPLFVISAYSRPGVSHRFANTTDVLATIEEILGLEPMSQFDRWGRPLRDAFVAEADRRPYTALVPRQSLTETNPSTGRGAGESARLDLRKEDAADEALFNRVLWRAIKGEDVPYPGVRRMSALDAMRR